MYIFTHLLISSTLIDNDSAATGLISLCQNLTYVKVFIFNDCELEELSPARVSSVVGAFTQAVVHYKFWTWVIMFLVLQPQPWLKIGLQYCVYLMLMMTTKLCGLLKATKALLPQEEGSYDDNGLRISTRPSNISEYGT